MPGTASAPAVTREMIAQVEANTALVEATRQDARGLADGFREMAAEARGRAALLKTVCEIAASDDDQVTRIRRVMAAIEATA